MILATVGLVVAPGAQTMFELPAALLLLSLGVLAIRQVRLPSRGVESHHRIKSGASRPRVRGKRASYLIGLVHGFSGSAALSLVVKGTVGDGSDSDVQWVVEVRVPFSDLAVSTPAPGEVWRGGFYRFNRGEGYQVEDLAWSPTLLDFHQPNRFGYLVFEGGAP